MKNLNIVFCLRRDWKENPGGDTIQMETWLTVLNSLGNHIKIFTVPVKPEELQAAHVVFIWHLERLHESFQPWQIAKQLKLPIILVSTYWHGGKRFIGFGLLKQCELLYRIVRDKDISCTCKVLLGLWSRCRKQILTKSSLLIVNSIAERELLISEGAEGNSMIKIPNVIKTNDFRQIKLVPWEQRTLVACVGHFCPRKNQLGLIRALKGSNISITFVGGFRPMHRRYMNRCMREAGAQHHFLGRLSHIDTLNVLGKSKVSISASLAETPGICNLEAAAAGCVLILPSLTPVKEYFGELSVYIDPRRINIQTISQAMKQKPSPLIQQNIFDHYTEKNLLHYLKELNIDEVLSCTN